MRWWGLAAILLVSAAATVSAQQAETRPGPALKLRLRERIAIPEAGAQPVLVPVKCDLSGNLYFSTYQPTKPMQAPVFRISSDGKKVVSFGVASVPGFRDVQVFDFAVGLRGEVHALVLNEIGEEFTVNIVRFREDGSHSQTTKLDRLFNPAQIALLPSGGFLVSGVQVPEKPETGEPGKPFTAIFDESGRWVKDVTLEGDVEAKKPEEGAKENPDSFSPIFLGTAIGAEDGNVYLLRRSDNPVVYVLAADGSTLRRLQFRAPSENWAIITMKVAGGRIALFYEERNPRERAARHLLILYDAESGKELFEYEVAREFGGIFACYTPNAFSFLGVTPDNRLAIEHAVPY